MRKLVLIVHTSLDGFVAGTKGELDGFVASEENLQFVTELSSSGDTALFGRSSHQMMNSYWATAYKLPDATKGTLAYSTWYNSVQKFVVSKSLKPDLLTKTQVISNDIAGEVTKIKNQPGKDIIIFGSPSVVQELMKHNLIDEYWVFINPAIFGKGIALFTALPDKITLKLTATKSFVNGEVALHYVVER
jgi:dihydrofolate reductase